MRRHGLGGAMRQMGLELNSEKLGIYRIGIVIVAQCLWVSVAFSLLQGLPHKQSACCAFVCVCGNMVGEHTFTLFFSVLVWMACATLAGQFPKQHI
jgi:hypothetical protein